MNKIWIQISKNDESKTDPVLNRTGFVGDSIF